MTRAAAALVLIAVLAGCAATPSDAATFPDTDTRQALTNTLIQGGALPEDPTPAMQTAAVDLASAICDSFDAGQTFAQVMTTLMDAGNDDPDTWIGAAVGIYCPEHSAQIGQKPR